MSFGLVALFLAAVSPAVPAEAAIPLVDIRSVDRTIAVELRYATKKNVAGRPFYPLHTRAFVRPEVAQRLAVAQAFLRRREHGLKIWDAYRPRSAQVELWQAVGRNDYVANPETTNGSLHSWGLAVDATLVNSRRQPVIMPTDFDDFTPAAFWHYQGTNENIRANLRLLQSAMAQGGFLGLRTEWWHFVASDWKNYVPDPNMFSPRETPSENNL
jgi:zinc D-Ala-D-Ala dipeptidase